MKYRLMPDGRIIFPEKGPPPETIPEGYVRDSGNTYILVPDYKSPCLQRTLRQKILPCGKFNNVHWCEHYEVIVTPPFCNECDVELGIRNMEPKERRL